MWGMEYSISHMQESFIMVISDTNRIRQSWSFTLAGVLLRILFHL